MKPDILPAGLFVASKNNLQHEPAPHFGFDEFSFHAKIGTRCRMAPTFGRRENSQHKPTKWVSCGLRSKCPPPYETDRAGFRRKSRTNLVIDEVRRFAKQMPAAL
jgi:hypothetical protein